MTLPSRNLGIALAGMLLAAACGTTVPVAQRAGSAAPDGLTSTGGGASSTTGPGATDGSAPVTDSSGGTTSGGSQSGTTGTSGGSSTTSSTGGSSGTSGTGAATTTGSSSGPAVSGSKITAPIQLGYLGAASSAGVRAALGTTGGTAEDPKEAFDYLVRSLNRQGGLAGRQIKPITSFIDPTSTNYETQASAACAMFTQDNHVAAVLAQEDFYYSENFSSCLKKAGVPEIEAITGGADNKTLANYPLLFSVSSPTIERRFAAMIKGLSDKGFLTKASKIGIIVEDCPYNLRAYDSTLAPAFKARGFNVTKRTISCVHGFGDAASAIAAFQNQVLPFAAAGVDRVMIMSGFEQIGVQYFEQQANQQNYKPQYALTSTSNSGENGAGFSPAVLQRIQGVGWEPDLDSVTVVPNGPANQRCTALFKGYAPALQRLNKRNNEMLCELFFFYEAGLKATNGHSDAKTLVAGLHGLGTSYVSPLSLTGATGYGPNRKDGPQVFATFGYLSKCQCIGYTGAPKPLA